MDTAFLDIPTTFENVLRKHLGTRLGKLNLAATFASLKVEDLAPLIEQCEKRLEIKVTDEEVKALKTPDDCIMLLRIHYAAKALSYIYHHGGNERHLRLTMLDVAALFPDRPDIENFIELRKANLMPELEKRVLSYVMRGGQLILNGESTRMLASRRLLKTTKPKTRP